MNEWTDEEKAAAKEEESKIKGAEGERKVNSVLKKFLPSDEYHCMQNVILRLEGGGKKLWTEIDHVIVSRYGIFVIESKYWDRKTIANPDYKNYSKDQNEGHVTVLKKCLGVEAENFFPVNVMMPISSLEKISLPEGTILLEQLIPDIKSKTTVVFDDQKVIDLFAKIESFRSSAKIKALQEDKQRHDNQEKTVLGSEIKVAKTNGSEAPQERIAGQENREKNHIDEEIEVEKIKQTKNWVKFGVVAVIFLALLSAALVYLNSQRSSSAATPPATKSSQPAPPTEGAATATETDGFRERFIAELAQYESEVEPQIEAIGLQRWGGGKHAELKALKARAIEYFSKSDYLLAREDVRQARALAAQAAVEYAERLAVLKRDAKAAFADDRALAAQHAVRQALHLNPADAEMLALQKRIAVMPQVLDWLRQAAIARNENRLEKEAAALQKALSLDAQRRPAAARLKALRGQLKQQRFADAARQAQRALEVDDLAAAQQHIARIKALFPASQELKALQNRLAQASAEKTFAAQTSLGEQAKAGDDWAGAERHFARARQLKPDEKTAIEKHEFSRRVVDAARQVRLKLDQAHRLIDLTVLDSVVAYLRKIAPLTEASRRLGLAHAELARQARAYATEVDVLVVSDNATHIIVRGEGQVGKVLRRTIRLRPGRRVFEGARAGYQSKLVTVDIRPGAPTVEVVVVCDEKI